MIGEPTTLGELSPGDVFETLTPHYYGTLGVVTDGRWRDESEVVWMDGFRGRRRCADNSTPVRKLDVAAAADEIRRLQSLCESLAARCAAQSETLSRMAETGKTISRIIEGAD